MTFQYNDISNFTNFIVPISTKYCEIHLYYEVNTNITSRFLKKNLNLVAYVFIAFRLNLTIPV